MSSLSFCFPEGALKKDSESLEVMIDVLKMLHNSISTTSKDELDKFQNNIWNKTLKFSCSYFNCLLDFVNKQNPMSFIQNSDISIMDKTAFLTWFMFWESFQEKLHEFIKNGKIEGDISAIVIPDCNNPKYEDDCYEII